MTCRLAQRRLAGLTLLMLLLGRPSDGGQQLNRSGPTGETTGTIGGWLLADLRRLRAFPHLDRAYRLIERKQWQEARHELEVFTSLQPDHLEARRAYVLLLYRLAAYDDVIRVADELERHHANAPEVWLYRGLAKHARGNELAAIEDFDRALKSGLDASQHRFALDMLADVALSVRHYADAAGALELLSKVESSFRVRLRQGLVLDGLERPIEAVAKYREALVIATNDRERLQAYGALAESATKGHAWDDARDALISALAIDARNVSLIRRLANLAIVMHDCTSRAVRDSLKLVPDPKSQESLAQLLYSCGDYRAAADEFRAVLLHLTASSDRARIYMALGYTYASLQDHHQATLAFERVAASRPGADVFLALGRSKANEGRRGAAIAALRRGLAYTPAVGRAGRGRSTRSASQPMVARGDLLVELAQLELANGDSAEALRDFRAALTNGLSDTMKAAVYREIGFLNQRSGRLEDARDAFERAVAAAPADAAALGTLGEINLQLGAVDRSIDYFARSLALKPAIDTSRALGRAYEQAGRTSEALAIYRRLLTASTSPNESVSLLTTIGALEFQRGGFADAAQAYARAFDLGGTPNTDLLLQAARSFEADRDWQATADVTTRLLELPSFSSAVRAEAFQRLGQAYNHLDRPNDAIAMLKSAVDAVPDALPVRRDLAFALFARADYAEALSHFRSTAAQSNDPLDWVHVARCLDELGKPGLALAALQRAAGWASSLSSADRVALLVTIGDHYAAQQQLARSIEMWTEAWAFEPSITVGLRLASAYRQSDRLSDALGILDLIEPDVLTSDLRGEYLDERARTQLETGAFEEAVTTLEGALAAGRTASRLYERGIGLTKLNRLVEAVNDLRAATELDPANGLYLESLGYANKNLGRYQEAARAFERAVELDPDRLSAYAELGDIALRSGDRKMAASWFGRVIDTVPFRPIRDPSDPENLNRTLQRLRRQQAMLARPIEVTTYLGTGPLRWQDSVGPFQQSSTGATGAAEVTVPLRTGASTLARPLKVVGRLFWPVDQGLETASLQVSMGLIYKPFARVNFLGGVERLFVLGPTGADHWVLRAAYSWDLAPPQLTDRRLRQYGLVFTDGAFAVHGAVDRQYGIEGRRGVTIATGDSWQVSPHLVAAFRYQSATMPRADIEAGAGLFVRRLVGATAHVDHRAILDTLLQYRGIRPMHSGGSTTSGGWTWTTMLHF